MLEETHDNDQIIQRVAALDVCKTHIRVIDGDGEPEREEVKELVAAG